MTSWTSGYVSEIDYTHGYYRELSPAILSLAMLSRNVMTRSGRPFCYLELGFGQGLSLAVHAAACPGEFWGTDFNPAHVATAQELAEAAGSGARIFDLSFAQLAARDDLPEFDVIALHGIWSWISDENRAVIVDLACRKLAVGRIFYLSYNCTPGWSPAMPLRHLMTLHADLAGSDDQGIAGKIDGAITFVQDVVDSGALYFRANPAVAERLNALKGQDRHYLAHEYFNQDWDSMPFSQVADRLASAKLNFAASANLLDHVDSINFTDDGQNLLARIGHPLLRESVRDYLISQQFRRDIFVKGGRTMSVVEQQERYRSVGFVLLIPPDDIPLTFNGAVGELTLQEALYKPLIAILAENGHAPKTVADIVAHPGWAGKSIPQLLEVLVILTGLNYVHPTQDAEATKAARPRCEALNAYLCNRARYNGDAGVLASPVIGGGAVAPRFWQLFLLARKNGRVEPEAWAAYALETLQAQDQRLLKDGKTLETDDENLAELNVQATEFAEKRLPILAALGITL